MSAVITSYKSFTRREQKDTFTSQFAHDPLIAVLFQSFEVRLKSPSKLSHLFQTE